MTINILILNIFGLRTPGSREEKHEQDITFDFGKM